MNRLLLALSLLSAIAANSALAEPNPRVGARTVLLWQAVDGDTIKRGNLRVRAVGYDTPELRGKCQAEKDLALKAKARLSELMTPPNRFSLKWAKGKDEFGRGLATFYSNGKPIGPVLIQEGLAHPYSRATGRQGWC